MCRPRHAGFTAQRFVAEGIHRLRKCYSGVLQFRASPEDVDGSGSYAIRRMPASRRKPPSEVVNRLFGNPAVPRKKRDKAVYPKDLADTIIVDVADTRNNDRSSHRPCRYDCSFRRTRRLAQSPCRVAVVRSTHLPSAPKLQTDSAPEVFCDQVHETTFFYVCAKPGRKCACLRASRLR